MVRFARVVALDVAHHITQRGNARRFILETERAVYLDFAPTGHPAIRRRTDRLLPDVQSRSPPCCAPKPGCFGAQLEADTRPIRFLLERGESFQRARVA